MNILKDDFGEYVILYHGSSDMVKLPKYGYGARNNDYGIGFYCTENENLSKEWAGKGIDVGFSNKYKLRLNGLSVLELGSRTDEDVLKWVYVLSQNRTFILNPLSMIPSAIKYLGEKYKDFDYRSYDVIEGYRADDSYFGYVQMFLSGVIDISVLRYAMSLGKLGKQVVLISKKSFDSIEYIGSVRSSEDFKKRYRLRDENARKSFMEIGSKSFVKGKLITDFMREDGFK